MQNSAKFSLAHVPSALFSVGMGLGGLGAAWLSAAHHLGMTALGGHALFVLTTGVTVLVMALYALKSILHRDAVVQELHDIATANFFPGLTISLMFVAFWLKSLGLAWSTVLWQAAAVGHVVLALVILRSWILRNAEITRANPSMFVPIVGLFVVPLTSAGMEVDADPLAWFCFSVALLFWLALFPVMLNRILFHGQLPRQFLPTLFILIAPPALAASALAALQGSFGIVAQGFFYAALFQGLLLATMARTFISLPFHLSWWAFTFPSAALASAAMTRHALAPDRFSASLAALLLTVATLISCFVALRTARAFLDGDLWPNPEDVQANSASAQNAPE